jgi:methylamine--corrinoid protein Co-methyltransferase
MRNTGRLINVLDRMEDGPVTSEKDFDRVFITERIKELVAEFDIHFDGDNIVNTDDDMADRCFEAGLTLAVDAGVYCTSNQRRLVWTRREIEEGIKAAPSSMTLGFGRDAFSDRQRVPEDVLPPTLLGGPVGVPTPGDLFTPVMQSYAQEPLVDALMNATLEDVYGRAPRTKSPWEVLSAWHEAELTLTALRRAGREGMSIGCVASAASDIAELSATSYGGFRKTDYHIIAMISELKVNYELLNKVAHLIRTDSIIHTFYNPIYGGLAGGAGGMAIVAVAGMILMQMAYMTTTHSSSPTHPFHACNTTPEILWVSGLYTQALARNTPFLTVLCLTPAGGPCTKELLYETAAMGTLATVSGVTRLMGPRSAAGIHSAHCTGLEARLFGEIGHATAGMSRGEADGLIQQLLPKYKDTFENPDIGKPFDEAYDLHTLQPTAEWLGMYDEVKEELVQMGFPLG